MVRQVVPQMRHAILIRRYRELHKGAIQHPHTQGAAVGQVVEGGGGRGQVVADLAILYVQKFGLCFL